jgi:quinol monooxygenase YgiN
MSITGRRGRSDVFIVGGWIQVAPAERDTYLEERTEKIRWTRAREGCHDFVLSADPVESDRVRVFEVWESQDAMDARLQAQRAAGEPEYAVKSKSSTLIRYEVASSRPN